MTVPPMGMIKDPTKGVLESFVKPDSWRKAQGPSYFCAIEGVPPIMSGAIGDKGDQLFRLCTSGSRRLGISPGKRRIPIEFIVDQVTNASYQFNVGTFVLAADRITGSW